MTQSGSLPAPQDISDAAALLADHIRTTPVVEVDAADLGVVDGPGSLQLKLELLQQSGTFKARGAMHALLRSPPAADGVVAASGGNHGVAVAWAAGRLGMPAHIFVPEVSAPAKVERLRSLGAQVHQIGSEYVEALEASMEFVEQHDVVTVHAYDQFEVMAGAGTMSRELARQAAPDTVVMSCGGGGLSGGAARWFGGQVRLIVVETELTPTYASAVAAGEPVDVDVSGVGADALGARRLGALGWQALSSVGAESALVTDDEVLDAMAGLWETCRLRVEPAAAAALAALRSGRVAIEPDERVAVVICGANVA